MALGFLWFSSFSKFHYDQKLAAISAAASAILFLLPAVLINAPIRQLFTLTAQNLGRLLDAILLLALATITVASFYNFRLTSLAHIYDFRNALYFPGIVRYLIGIVSSALVPFAFACCLALGRRWKAAFALLLMLLFYPVTLSKLALFAPVWTVAVVVLSRFSGPKTTTILLVLLPMLFGLSLIGIFPHGHPALDIFGLINIRMIATPSSATDGVCMRAGGRSRQPGILRPAAAFYPGLRCLVASDSPEHSVHDGVANPRRRDTVPVVVRCAARDISRQRRYDDVVRRTCEVVRRQIVARSRASVIPE